MAKIIADRRVMGKSLDDELGRKKANIADSYTYFKGNYKRFNRFYKFICDTSLSDEEAALNLTLGKTTLEFNILEAYISKLRGEFAKMEPSVEVRAADDAVNTDPRLIEFIESHLRAIFFDSNKDNMQYDVFTDVLIGGFSAVKVYTDYVHERSFDQNIYMSRVYNPTLVAFDKLARESHKGDGMFCCELYPRAREEFEAEYGKSLTDKMNFTRNVGDFSWSYSTDGGEIVLVGDYYEKKKSKGKIVQLVDGRVMTTHEYDKFVADWNAQTDFIMQAPGIIGKPRTTEFTRICRTVMTENDTLEYNETDFKFLPIIFIDGNSVQITDESGTSQQMTRPYPYHAESIQKLKNYAGNSLATELENMIMSKIMMPKEGIPAEYKDAYINPQRASVYIFNAFKDENGQIPLPPPQAIPKPPIPPELTNTFTLSDEITQHILGSYDAALGINNNELSGNAIIEGAMQSNLSALPWTIGYAKGMNRVAEIVIDLMPKYITKPRNMPVKGVDGKNQHMPVNTEGGVSLNYKENAFNVKVQMGVNFQIQQQRAFKTLAGLMQISEPFNAFMMQEEGILTLLNNIDIRGIDSLKQGVAKFVQGKQQEQKQMQQSEMQQSQMPLMIKQAEIQQKAQKDAADIKVKQQDADTRRMVGIADIAEKADRLQLDVEKLDSEGLKTEVSTINAIANIADASHKQAMDMLELHHENERHGRQLMHAQKLAEISSREKTRGLHE